MPHAEGDVGEINIDFNQENCFCRAKRKATHRSKSYPGSEPASPVGRGWWQPALVTGAPLALCTDLAAFHKGEPQTGWDLT